jgi:hypothetical protein
MSNLLLHLLAWPAFLVAVLVFGFAPGAVLRLIVLGFRRDDPRRRELLGEVYHVPRLERPFWVCEQLERALFEGLGPRICKAVKRYDARGRFVRGLREARHDIINSSYTLGELLVGWSLAGSPVYIIVYLKPYGGRLGIGSVCGFLALGAWVAFGSIRAHYYQRYRKRCEEAGITRTFNRLDRLVFQTLVPAVYIMTAYSFVRDMIVLISGNFGGGYWAGLVVSLIALWMPWNEIWMARQFQRFKSVSSNS